MMYANDEIFNIGYNAKTDKLQIKPKKYNKIKGVLHGNKFFATLGVLFIMFCFLNCALIYTFMDLLKNL